MKLYELTGQWLELINMLQDESADPLTIIDTLEGLDFEIEEKADNYAKIIKELEGQARTFASEKKRLEERQKTLESRIKWLKDNLSASMHLTGKTKFKTDLFSFGIQKNGGIAPLKIDENAEIPQEFCKSVPDNALIREALESGKELGFARLEEKGEHLVIR